MSILDSLSSPGHAGAKERRLMHRLHLDLPLLVGLLLLAGVGMVVLYSAGGQDTELLVRQLVRLSVAFAVLVAVAQIPPSQLYRWAPWLYGAGLILLFAVMLLGEVGKGAQRWLDLGVVRFQPSELMKIAVPMMVAFFLADAPLPPRAGRLFLGGLLLIVPMLLVAEQPDLGTAILIGSAGFFVLLFAGMRWRLVLGLVALVAATAPLAWQLLHEYQRQRVLTFLNPGNDPLGAGYHIIQSTIAIGSGGLYGKGWLNGTQSHLDFLPERHTDFVFAVFAEEFGFIGVLLLLGLFLFVVGRGLYIAAQAQTTFARLLAGALVMSFFVYLFVNIGMVSGLLPVVGVPLPLISYGGTSLVTVMAAFGILMSIHTHRRLIAA